MGWQTWNQKAKNLLLGFASPIEVFHLFTLTILSLLLPTSFLLLAMLSASHQYSYPRTTTSFLHIYSLLLRFIPDFLYLLVSIVSVATLIHGLTCKFAFFNRSSSSSTSLLKLPLLASWILLCSFQICVGLGIEGNIATDAYDSGDPSFGLQRSFFSRLIFLLGLHETTQVWYKTVVKPVVDDSVLGTSRKERWVERVAVGASLGGLWWWRLREEVETLVVMAAAKTEQLIDMEMRDFVGWWLYYLTVTIGMVRILKGVLWITVICVCRRRVAGPSLSEPDDDDDKV